MLKRYWQIQIVLPSPVRSWSSTHAPSTRLPSGVIKVPCPLRLPFAYSPSNSTSGLPFSVQRKIPRPDAKPSLHGPDHVTDSSGWGSGFQTLHGLFVVVIQSGGAGFSFWAIASDVTNNIVAV